MELLSKQCLSLSIPSALALLCSALPVLGAESQSAGLGSTSLDSAENKASEWQIGTDTDVDPNSLMPLDVALTLNKKFIGNISIKIDPRSEYGLLDSQRFLALLEPIVGEKFLSAVREMVDDKPLISFSDASNSSMRVHFDSLSLELVAELQSSEFDAQQMSLRNRRSAPNPSQFTDPASVTAGVNISALQRYTYNQSQRAFDQPRVSVDGFFNLGGFAGVTVNAGASYDGNAERDEQWERRQIVATKDFFGPGVRLVAGEITPSVESFQGSGRVIGAGIFSAYSKIRPFDVIRPTGRREFVLDEEARVDVFVNGDLVETMDLEAGSFSLQDFPLTNRANDVRLEITSISGVTEVIDFSVYGGSELLKPGLREFGAYAGFRERSQKLRYGDQFVASGFVRQGINGMLTLGVNGQITEQAQQLGVVATVGGSAGLVQIEAASSRHAGDGRTGYALGVDYRQRFSLLHENDLRISANAEFRSDRFQHAFEDLTLTPLKWRSGVQATWAGGAGLGVTLGLSASEGRLVDGSIAELRGLDLTLSKSLGKFRLGSSVSVTDKVGLGSDTRFNLTVAYRPSRDYSSSGRYDSSAGRTQLELRRLGTGNVGSYDGSLRYSEDERHERLRLAAGYTHNRYKLDINHNHRFASGDELFSSGQSELRLATFAGLSGGQFGIGRPTRDGFVISPVHKSLKNSRVEIRNGEDVIARSGFLGAPLVPLSRAYAVNRFDIMVHPLPVGYDLGEGVISTFPGQGNSYTIPIGSDASRTALGYVLTASGPLSLVSGVIVPLNESINKEAYSRPFFTNRRGRFIADRLIAGDFAIIVGGETIAEFNVPEEADGIVQLGEILSD